MRLDNPNMWIVVSRCPNDMTSKGNIERFGLNQTKANGIAEQLNISHPSLCFWAMPETSYDKPFSN